MRWRVWSSFAVVGAAFALTAFARHAPPATLAPPAAAEPRDGSHDFDFWIGDWNSRNKRLVKRLAGSHEWQEFESTHHAVALMGGMANYDEFVTSFFGPDWHGMTVRVYNRDTHLWSLYWVNSKGEMDPPVVGTFVNGVGTMEGHQQFEGKTILVRFIWSQITKNSCHWEQAFSTDEGKTWETNWIISSTRVGTGM
jgi:hypothetical protein